MKSHLRDSLKLDTSDALMQVSLCKIEAKNLDWRVVFDLWRNMKNHRVLNMD